MGAGGCPAATGQHFARATRDRGDTGYIMSDKSSRGVDWDAATYHRVSTPQISWGMKVLPRLGLTRTETVVDAGCGSGRLTLELLRQLPDGRVIAVDQSAAMLEEAARYI